MSDWLDQIFIRIKQLLLALLAGAPDWVMQIVSSLINIFALLGVFLTLFALISVLERKILGRMQNRYGPNRVGPFGLLQPIADGIKFIVKEDLLPPGVNKPLFLLAPLLAVALGLTSLAVIPFGESITIAGHTEALQISGITEAPWRVNVEQLMGIETDCDCLY